jgi:hypothetical protein
MVQTQAIPTKFSLWTSRKVLLLEPQSGYQEFKDLNPTAENISLVIYQLLLPKIKNNKKIALPMNHWSVSAEYPGQSPR